MSTSGSRADLSAAPWSGRSLGVPGAGVDVVVAGRDDDGVHRAESLVLVAERHQDVGDVGRGGDGDGAGAASNPARR